MPPLSSLVLAVLIAWPSAFSFAQAQAAPDGDRLIITEDADYFGHDLRVLKEVDFDRCKTACLAESACHAFTYNSRAQWCFLKSGFGELRRAPGAIAGRKAEQPRQEVNTGVPVRLGETAHGFGIPIELMGRTIYVRWPTNEHAHHAFEDMVAIAGFEAAERDILVGETTGIDNAYALIDGTGADARRMIVFDYDWSLRIGAHYRLVLAHEIAHHICGHTIGAFAGRPWEIELEADRTAGAILRKAHDNRWAIGGALIGLDDIIAFARTTWGGGSTTHPPGDMRLNAWLDGWRNGSPCLQRDYVPINPVARATAIERIPIRYGSEMQWWFNYSYVRTEINGSDLRIVVDTPSNELRQAGARRGTLIFEGTSSDPENIQGTFWHYERGCPKIAYPGEGVFRENVGILLVGSQPQTSSCRIIGEYPGLLHLFKNTSDWGFVPPRR